MIDFKRALTLLSDARVEFIVIGGAAATAHGSARLTQDLDVLYRRTRENIERIVRALAPVSPYLRGAPKGLPFVWDVETVRRGLNFTLETEIGDLDVLGEIIGGTYDSLLDHSIELDVFGVRVRCLNLEALIRVKQATARPKDLEAIAELRALLRERHKG